MTPRVELTKLCAKAGATLRIDRVGIHHEIRVGAPDGHRFAVGDFHESVTATLGSYDFSKALDDVRGGFEPCNDSDCEWCGGF